MIYLENLKYMKLYRKKFALPIDKQDKKHGSVILLLTPNYESSKFLMNHPLTINFSRSYQSYMIERDIMYLINNESKLQIDHYDHTNIINEQAQIYTEVTDFTNPNRDDYTINEVYCQLGDKMIFFNEMYDESILEATGYAARYKRLLWNDRIRNNREVFQLYKTVKADNPWVKKAFVNYERYKRLNLFDDLYFYNQSYLNNNRMVNKQTSDMYYEFISRAILDKRIDKAGYTKKTVFIPIDGWEYDKDRYKITDYLKVLNPISMFYKKLKLSPIDLAKFKGIDFVFFGKNGYFKMDYDSIETKQVYNKFLKFIKVLQDNEVIDDSDEPDNSQEGITSEILDDLEKNRGIAIHNLTGSVAPKPSATKTVTAPVVSKSTITPVATTKLNTTDKNKEIEKEELKAELVKKVSDAAKDSADKEETLSKMDKDLELKRIIDALDSESDEYMNISATRLNRINNAQSALMTKKLQNTSIKDMIEKSNRPKELPETNIPIKTINDEWHHLKGVNFEKEYDLNADIVKILNSFSDPKKEFPISILDISAEDTSTSEDLVETYTVKCEGYDGKRFTLKFDIPKFRDNRFMRLRGNDKIFSGELPLLPISKTSDDTVQIASNYKKIFISRYYTSSGKSNPYADCVLKALSKYKGNNIKIVYGDNSRISSLYELPIDYVDFANTISEITYRSDKNTKITLCFNQERIRKEKGVNLAKGIPYAITDKGDILYYNTDTPGTFSEIIVSLLSEDKDFAELFSEAKVGKKYTYSRATILATDIPVIVILAHGIGLTKTMELAGVEYSILDKKDKRKVAKFDDYIEFEDGIIAYKTTYESLMLMNGLKDCNTEDYPISSINTKRTWIEMLDNFGGRIKADGLDNFKDLMFDPLTKEVCRDYKLPDDYFEALIYSNNLLCDNKFIAHTNIDGNRYRTNEVVAVQFYQAISDAYKTYALQNKHGKKVAMTMKQSAVIDLILAMNTTSDLSIFQPLYEVETKNAVAFKGSIGLNTERAYTMEKRGYDDSMLNTIAQATGFAATAGVNRQMTINPNITGGRGYFKNSTLDDVNVTNTLSMTEALSPYTITSDDSFRNQMTFVQTSKHTTPIENASPLLVTTGADAAMPYLTSDMFCHKSKRKGTVKEINDKYLLVEYDDESTEYVSLAEQTMKNSDGGFYISLQLKTDLKPGAKVKENTILAYDPKSFSNKVGDRTQLAYNMGCIGKVAIMTTEDGYEDSGAIGGWLSENMASDIVTCKPVDLPPSTNVLFLAKVGQHVSEGDPVLIFQNAFDEEDANLLLKNLNGEDGDISEIGRNTIAAKTTGVVSDIKIYRTVEVEELSDSLKKIVTNKEREIKKLKSVANKSSNDTFSLFDSTEKLPQTGKLKNVEGVRIEIYVKYHDKVAVGDKLVVNNANKVVVMNTFSEEDSPYTDFRPEEKIDLTCSCSSLDGRMITSSIKIGALYKLMIELSRSVKDIMGVKWKTIHEMSDIGKF